MNKNIKLLLLTGLVFISSIFCSVFTPSGKSTSTPQVEQATHSGTGIEENVKTPSSATLAAGEVSTPEPGGEKMGAISGSLNYPSEGIPPLRIVAFRSDNNDWYATEVTSGNEFKIENLPAGNYTVVAYPLDVSLLQTGVAGGYSNYVLCGLSADCSDHTLVEVIVKAGETTSGILPGDWYAPENTFPKDPSIN
jgi:hypothetical protein